jgi:CSLREA domain-containing protein
LALTAALGVAALPGLAEAAIYTVNTSGDAGDGTCDATCTLRDAVAAATSGSDTVTFASTLSGDTITLDIAGKGHIAITHGLTIQGPGANLLTVSGGNVASSGSGGIFDVTGNNLTMTISGITLADGNATGKGGALSFASGSLTLNGVAIRDNYAQSFAGGFYKGSGTLNVNGSTISGNRTNNSGGGFTLNYATTSLVNNTISGNSANGSGGGFYARANVTIINSTISGNSANSLGGGFWLSHVSATLTNSIVANNTAAGDAEFVCTAQSNGASSVTANNTLIEGSYACTGGSTFTGSSSNILGQDPKLGRLAHYGGPTETLALLPGSPAIDAGDNSTCAATDQRGEARPYDGDKNGSTICDMGAFEVSFIDLDRIFDNGFD